ncbi:MAG TPA: flagellar basal body P-ring formation chaperone FlgA [Bryobacteraceae bacterium]|nr:flagellar basal body P-ring formation chaperone FlgA [Bryobacteraceae bacterium]
MMTRRIASLLLAALASAGAQCLPVEGPRILAGDMARAVAAFAELPPELALGYAPPPGSRRAYRAPELARLARRYGLAPEPGREVCFVRPLVTLTSERVAAALHAALPAAHIEVVEFSRQPIPQGELRFPASGLRVDQSGMSVMLWQGAVCASGQADFPVWARVRIRVAGKRVAALETLPAGSPIGRAQVREEAYDGPPGLPDLSEVVDRVPRRVIAAGTVIERQWLNAPEDVLRGDRVRVEVRCGPARVFLDGRAQSSGERGAVIGVRNPANGKILRATIVGHAHVVLTADGGDTISPEGKQP